MQADRHIQNRTLPHAKNDKIGFGVHEDGAANSVAPVVVVSDPSQARLNSAGHHRHSAKGLSRALAIGERGTVGPSADLAVRRIGVVVAHLSIGSVVVDHRIHVAG